MTQIHEYKDDEHVLGSDGQFHVSDEPVRLDQYGWEDWSMMAGVSIGPLFLAGVIPGIVMGATMMLTPVLLVGGMTRGVFTPTEVWCISASSWCSTS